MRASELVRRLERPGRVFLTARSGIWAQVDDTDLEERLRRYVDRVGDFEVEVAVDAHGDLWVH